MKIPRTLLVTLCLCTAAVPAADVPTAREFGWLSGHWCSERDGVRIEEFWLPAAGDVALGVGRTVKGGRTTSFEFMRIQTRGGETSLVAVLEGQAPTSFPLTQSGADWARFENPRHDFPKRIEFRRTESGLHTEIAGPGKGGKERVIPFDYRGCLD